jgi:hypothetical protein
MRLVADSDVAAGAEPSGTLREARQLRGGKLLRIAILALVLSVTILQHFGVTIGTVSVNGSLPIMFGVLAVAAMTGRLQLARDRLIAYSVLVGLAAATTVVNGSWGAADRMSLPSMLLLLAVYLPFVFTIRASAASDPHDDSIQRMLADVLLFCALVGIAQFAIQFVYPERWIFDLGSLLPEFMRSTPGYNTVISMGDLTKSNGLFFKEPSFFSLAMAFGLLLEIARYRRIYRMVLMVLALMITYSGSGLLVLAVGLLFPLRAKTLLRVAAIALVGSAVAAALWDVLNLGLTAARVTEFGEPGASGYQRYVAPVLMLIDSINAQPWTFWLGHGPGAMARLGDTTFFVFHDPTFAKATFEYGTLGLAALIALAVLSLRASAAPMQLRAAAFFCWLATGGYMQTPEIVYLMMLFGGLTTLAVPAPRTASEPAFASPPGAPIAPTAHGPAHTVVRADAPANR